MPAGDYFVQALLHRYETFHRADGHVVKLPMDRGEGQHWDLAPGTRAALPDEYPERALYIADGEIETRGSRFGAGKMLVFDTGEDTSITALTPATVMALGGEPVGERFIEWNFVSSSLERIEQAKADWRAGRMKLPDFDNQEFIPLT